MLARLGAMERECGRIAESREHLTAAQELCARHLPADHPLAAQVAGWPRRPRPAGTVRPGAAVRPARREPAPGVTPVAERRRARCAQAGAVPPGPTEPGAKPGRGTAPRAEPGGRLPGDAAAGQPDHRPAGRDLPAAALPQRSCTSRRASRPAGTRGPTPRCRCPGTGCPSTPRTAAGCRSAARRSAPATGQYAPTGGFRCRCRGTAPSSSRRPFVLAAALVAGIGVAAAVVAATLPRGVGGRHRRRPDPPLRPAASAPSAAGVRPRPAPGPARTRRPACGCATTGTA